MAPTPPRSPSPGPARILYVFPHPDDECFGPAAAIARQRREGHEVHLLTLTRGGATKQRHALGLTVQEMGRVRVREMEAMAEVLELTDLTVLDFPDGGLAEIDPRPLENAIDDHIQAVRPDVVVTYPIHGISGFADHIVAHAVVKRVHCELGDRFPDRAARRLAFFTLAPIEDEPSRRITLRTSDPARIDCTERVTNEDVARARKALDQYVTYRDIVQELDPLGRVGRAIHFELFREAHDPRLGRLTEGL